MVVILTFKNNTLKSCWGRNKYHSSMGISGEICACLLPGKWWQLIYLSLYIGESLLILYEDYKKLFKLQATLCTMLLVENQQMENISAFWGKGVVRKMNRYKGRRGWRYRAKTPLFLEEDLLILVQLTKCGILQWYIWTCRFSFLEHVGRLQYFVLVFVFKLATISTICMVA